MSTGSHVARADPGIVPIDFSAPAEVFSAGWRRTKRPSGYRRFDTAAEAVRFVIEELPAPLLLSACLEVDEQRFDSEGIRALYQRPDYPLRRAAEMPDEETADGATPA